MTFWQQQTVLVTGSSGFLGSAIVRQLHNLGADVHGVRRVEHDLREPGAVRQLLRTVHPSMIIHAAATVGGIGANRSYPGTFFYDNLLMGMNIIHEARAFDVQKLVIIGTVCSYPKVTPVPFQEGQLWSGYPEETNAAYGVAKKALLTMGQAYRQQYGMPIIHLLPTNLYGPHDNFDPDTSHVIPALIAKFKHAVDVGLDSVTLWGSGRATREFLYVEDAAEGILLAAERYDLPEPRNLGTGYERSIRQLAHLIASELGYRGEIVWDMNYPDGQPRRSLDSTAALLDFGYVARTPFMVGLRKTIEWYCSRLSSP